MAQPNSFEGWAKNAFAVRDEVAAAAARMDEVEVTRSSGGVTLTLTTSGAMRSIRIDPKAIADTTSLERHVMLAHQEAFAAVRQAATDMLGPLRDFVTRATNGMQA